MLCYPDSVLCWCGFPTSSPSILPCVLWSVIRIQWCEQVCAFFFFFAFYLVRYYCRLVYIHSFGLSRFQLFNIQVSYFCLFWTWQHSNFKVRCIMPQRNEISKDLSQKKAVEAYQGGQGYKAIPKPLWLQWTDHPTRITPRLRYIIQKMTKNYRATFRDFWASLTLTNIKIGSMAE